MSRKVAADFTVQSPPTSVVLVAPIFHSSKIDFVIRPELSKKDSGTLNVMGDMLGSLATVFFADRSLDYGLVHVDPALSLLIAVLIAYSSLKLVREAFH
jgi:Co/Zn/Cd efflux system component